MADDALFNSSSPESNAETSADSVEGASTSESASKEELTDQEKETQLEALHHSLKELIDEDGKLLGRYNSVTEAKEGIKELRGKVRERQEKKLEAEVPEEYSFDFSENETLKDVELDTEGPLLKSMLPVFKEAGLTQAQADQVVKTYLEMEQSSAVDFDQIRTDLGENSDEIIMGLTQKFEGLSKEELASVNSWMYSAKDVQLLSKLAGVDVGLKVPGRIDAAPAKSADEYQREADSYYVEHKDTIGMNDSQQKHWAHLVKMTTMAASRQKK